MLYWISPSSGVLFVVGLFRTVMLEDPPHRFGVWLFQWSLSKLAQFSWSSREDIGWRNCAHKVQRQRCIDEIDRKENPRSTFTTPNEEYYRQAYGAEIYDLEQPLKQPKKREIRVRGVARPSCLFQSCIPAQVCLVSWPAGKTYWKFVW